MSLQDRLLRATRSRVVGRAAYLALKALGVEFPRGVVWTGPVELAHGAVGLVVHHATRIGRDVILMPGVVIGRADSWIPPERVAHLGGGVVLGDNVTIGAGAKVLYSAGQELVVADGTIVGANAVLRSSTGPGEIWAGIPASRVGFRDRVRAGWSGRADGAGR
jgi:serine O-acetyltransferase